MKLKFDFERVPVMLKTNAAACAAFCFCAVLVDAQVPAVTPPVGAPALYASIADKPAIVYDSPSAKGEKQFIFARFQPVEVLVRLDKWAKIRDADNTVGWVEITSLGNTRALQVIANIGEVRAAPNATAVIVFEAQKSVLLESTGPAVNGWLPVKHRDGQSGFIARAQVWGE
jgi:SH3-like domain-containing protein